MDLHFELIHNLTISMQKIVLLCGFSLGWLQGKDTQKGCDARGLKNKGFNYCIMPLL